MLTTGFKLWFGFFVAAFSAAVFAGYTSGATETGPISLGWKGGVGNHVTYVLFVVAAAVFGLLGIVAVAFRDADSESVAEVLGVDTPPPAQTQVGSSIWPVLGALGVATLVVGLVVSSALFVVGLLILVAVSLEWTMTNWSERATGDPEVNSELRERLLRPVEIPILALAGIGVLVLAMSRVLLASSVNGAVLVAGAVGVCVFGAAFVFSRRPNISRRLVSTTLILSCVAVLVAGIVAAATGEREFHQQGGGSGGGHVEVDG
ncbi:MAG TPA: hypothetical protein QGF43_04535 [Acidimicrobiales bacterium]|jgi:hypothetical protein|nr:hypothetical protein [Actinomycetota bacterium]MDP6177736.1 hypothetical protein [Acidimicrobiales bacterium]MDP6280394.1 hypothetical protein [Acidimicrobiales bacterium]MDP7116824.1 hypothetical protein [Acidimicrobiales bacterium]MDP7411531.1 hypothetical protein [Acidimicrobiales bacterium]|tara:strand:- start:7731 stop:8516 length:786 start_codon:yes stop_codon:yes gene_type:complete